MSYINARFTKVVSIIIAAVCLSLAAIGQKHTAFSESGLIGPAIDSSTVNLIPVVFQGVAFTSNRDGNNEVYVMNPDGSGQTRVTTTTATVNDQRPDVSPDGSEIAFSSNRDGNFEIFVMNFDGSNVRQLTFTTGTVANSWPRWSPDGQWIAYQSGSGTDFQIFRIHSDGTAQTQVTNYAGLNQFPAWSPDGTRLAIRRDNDIYLINSTDGLNPVRLTFAGTINQMASFSPDGTRIAFLSNRDGYLSVFVMNSDGSGQLNFTPRPEGYSGTWTSRAPAWLTGQLIYFTAVRSVETGNSNENIYMKLAAGGAETQLTSIGANFEATVRGGLATTAASVLVSGRVTTPAGLGLRNARVNIVNPEGLVRTVLTGSLGYFTFDDVKVGETYIVGVTSKRYRFDSRVIQVMDDLANVDFIGLE
jgi:hypothetical protein